ncbi:MAG: FliI/YscN family ATPase [Luminiphilus sp.]
MTSPDTFQASQFARVNSRITAIKDALLVPEPVAVGRLTRLSGMRLEVSGLKARIGSRCWIETGHRQGMVAEVVGFEGEQLVLMCEGASTGLTPGAHVSVLDDGEQVTVGEHLLGRIIDGAGKPLDGLPLGMGKTVSLRGQTISPMDRSSIIEPLDVGVRAINSLLTVGKGQRMGLFAGSGVGKSTLLGMMTRFTEADVVVVGLVGERGREVREFVEDSLGQEGLRRSVVVATPADTSPLMRVAGCWRATAIAEYFRDQGKNVLLLMDSLTRFAQAQREIGLAAGEPPVSRGYTPSVFSMLPNLIERAGNVGSGSITAVYTVLVEGDDLQDPIADAARAILDGHIVLSRSMAEAGTYPAIDIEASISRSMLLITDPEQQENARLLKESFATYRANQDLISVGAYRSGADPKIDRAISSQDAIREFIRQPLDQRISFEDGVSELSRVASDSLVTQTIEPQGVGSQGVTNQMPQRQ